jgi:hypothetical protein
MVKLVLVVAVLAVVFLVGCEAVKKKETKGLQIGIKKKVEDCKQKSKKGDKLSMYTTIIVIHSTLGLKAFALIDSNYSL